MDTARTSAIRWPTTSASRKTNLPPTYEQVITADNLPIVDDPLATPEVSHIAPSALMPTGPVAPTSIGLALTGREPGMKQALLKAYGGNGQTEGAVGLGLRWLAAQQHRNGTVEPGRARTPMAARQRTSKPQPRWPCSRFKAPATHRPAIRRTRSRRSSAAAGTRCSSG